MNEEEIRDYCLDKPGVTEGLPFGDTVLVFKVNGKMFCLLSLDSRPLNFNVKCEPDMALELREQHPAVQPGFHMSKKHWNTIIVDGTLTKLQIQSFIDHSYGLVKK